MPFFAPEAVDEKKQTVLVTDEARTQAARAFKARALAEMAGIGMPQVRLYPQKPSRHVGVDSPQVSRCGQFGFPVKAEPFRDTCVGKLLSAAACGIQKATINQQNGLRHS